MKVYRLTGTFRMGHLRNAKFTIETIGDDEANARDRVLATLGSRHRVNRHQVEIESVKEIRPDEVTDAAVEKQLAMVK